MYSIGEIAKIVNISVDALRYYNEIKLLTPCLVEQDSRYRYYSEDQVSDLLFIMEMKQYGFSLEAIKELLNCSNKEHTLQAFDARYNELNNEMAQIQKSMISLKRRISEIEKEEENIMDIKSVLIADDSKFLSNIVKDILEKHNYKIAGQAASGKECIEKYTNAKPDLIIMDIHMSEEFDGIDAVKSIKKLDPASKIIMLSARCFLNTVLESILAGAYSFVAKPFQAEYLLDTIEKADTEDIYNLNTITKLLDNDDFVTDSQTKPASQSTINKMLELCCNDYETICSEALELIKDL